MIIADTNVWSEPLKRTPDPLVIQWLIQNANSLFMTVVTAHELTYGVELLDDAKKAKTVRRKASGLITGLESRLLPYTYQAATIHGVLRAEFKLAGKNLSAEDGQIAAIALAHNATLATRNTKDFAGTGVQLINP